MTKRALARFYGVVVALAVLLLAGAATARALTFNDIIDLKLAGVSETTILKLVESERAIVILSVDDILRLKDAGASEDFIRELMDTRERFEGADQDAYVIADDDDGDVYVYDDDVDWVDDYYALDPDDYATVFVYKYYDPFAYYWYPWPNLYVYYSPFWWNHSGFYFGGHWCSDWWDPWGPCITYCDSHHGFDHHFGHPRTRTLAGRTWHRTHAAAAERAEREATMIRRAGIAAPANIRTEARAQVADYRTRELRSTRTTRGVERATYRDARTARTVRGETRPATERHSVGRTQEARDTGQTRDARTREYRQAPRETRSTREAAPTTPRSTERTRSRDSSTQSSPGEPSKGDKGDTQSDNGGSNRSDRGAARARSQSRSR
jgi:hypothetical protein